MKNFIYAFLVIVFFEINIYCQNQTSDSISINIVKNAENLSGYHDEKLGAILTFDINNKVDQIGKGKGWLVYKDGNKKLDSLAKQLFSDKKYYSRFFNLELFGQRNNLSTIDTFMLNDFDIYVYLVEPEFLEYRLNTDGEGAGKTYSYYIKYPCDIKLYKKTSQSNFYKVIKKLHAKDEEEYFKSQESFYNIKIYTIHLGNQSK